LDKEALSQVPKELQLHHEYEAAVIAGTAVPIPDAETTTDVEEPLEPQPRTGLEEALRLEAYSWPRLVFPPLKKSGHIILDSCTAEGETSLWRWFCIFSNRMITGKIMRLTIPRSQGKQAFYDARKSGWGDIFPHPPKNPPQERYQSSRAKHNGGTTPTSGADIGKRGNSDRKKDGASYDALSKALKEKRKKSRRDRVANIRE
jgi:Mitochondrial small ribosomal subunit Rsm22